FASRINALLHSRQPQRSSMNGLTGNYSEPVPPLSNFPSARSKEEHDENPDSTCNRRGRDGDRRIGRGRDQERPRDGAARGVMQGASREEVFGDPLPEAARLRQPVHGPQRHGQGGEAETDNDRQGAVSCDSASLNRCRTGSPLSRGRTADGPAKSLPFVPAK